MTSLRNIISTVCLSIAVMAGAQASVVSFRVDGLPADTPVGVSLHAVGLSGAEASFNVKAPDGQGIYSSAIAPSPYDLYNLFIYNSEKGFQTQIPVYIPASRLDGKPIDLTIVDKVMIKCGIDDAANRDLYECASHFYRQSRTLSDWAVASDSIGLLRHLRSYSAVVDSVLGLGPVPSAVADYLRLWAYSTASDAFRMVVHLRTRAGLLTTVDAADFQPDPHKVLDCDMAENFGATAANISRTLHGTLPEKMAQLYADYSNPSVRQKVADSLVDSYVRSYNYSQGVQPGLDILADLQNAYGISPRWAEKLRASEAINPGSAFPSTVELVDTEGNAVPFSNFLGKWVYIDLWASWCGPCVQQIPHLKELEKTLADAPVTFVSISLDSDKEAWLKKVKTLDLHGNQLLDVNGTLSKVLNISGIPHFMLYGPDGRLVRYKTSRPSQPETLEMLRSLKI